MMDYNELIGMKLKQLREYKGMSLRDVASRSGITHKAIWNYENGRPIDVDKLNAICNALGYDMLDFLSDVRKMCK